MFFTQVDAFQPMRSQQIFQRLAQGPNRIRSRQGAQLEDKCRPFLRALFGHPSSPLSLLLYSPPHGGVRANLFQALRVDLRAHCCERPSIPLLLRLGDPRRETTVEVRIEGAVDYGVQDIRLQSGKRINFRLLDAKSLAPPIRTFLGLLKRRGRQSKLADLLDGKSDRDQFEFQIVKLKITESLKLAPD
jgi:hypothetical protein